MVENFNSGSRQSNPQDQRSVISLIADHEATWSQKRGYIQSIGRETHAESDGIFDPQKFGSQFLQFDVQIVGSVLLTRRSGWYSVFVDGFYGCFGARARRFRKAQVVVRAQV